MEETESDPSEEDAPEKQPANTPIKKEKGSAAAKKNKAKDDKKGTEKVATTKKTFYMHSHLNIAFNIAAAKRGIEKGTLLNTIIEEWLRKNGEI